MNDFDYDVMQKKRIARGAFNRKGGSKSKKCSLPSDNLTEAQKRKLSGPVQSVQLGQPCTWEQFKGLSDTLKKSYLMDLHNTYRASSGMLSKMFGVHITTVCDERARLGLPNCKKGHRASKEQRAMWDAFCNGVVGGGNSIIPGANEQIEAQDEQVESEPVQTKTQVWDLDSPDHVNAYRSEEPQVTCYDPEAEAEAEARAQERLADLRRQGVSMRDALFRESREASAEAAYQAAKDVISEYVANVENFAEQVIAEQQEPAAEDKKEPSIMRSLSAEYEGDADGIGWQLRNMMYQLFSGDRVKVKLSIEVCE